MAAEPHVFHGVVEVLPLHRVLLLRLLEPLGVLFPPPVVDPDEGHLFGLQLQLPGDRVEQFVDATSDRRRKPEA